LAARPAVYSLGRMRSHTHRVAVVIGAVCIALSTGACRTEGEEDPKRGSGKSNIRSQPATVSEREGSTTTVVPSKDDTKPEKVRIADPEGRYLVELRSEEFQQLTDPAAIKEVHPEAVVAWKGPDGCRGALLMSSGVVKKYAKLKPTADRRLEELPVSERKTLWYEPKRYNDRPGYRWSARGISKADGKTSLRYRYSIGNRDGWTFEVLARSPMHFSIARWCHDAVTASVTF